jgi:putative phosphoribosyl transferase
MIFTNRVDAGRRLATRLTHLRDRSTVVLGLPRGGVPVAGEVARALDAPLDVIVVRKLGVPSQPELGLGAIGEDGVRIINRRVVAATGVSEAEILTVQAREQAELERRARRYRGQRPRRPLDGKTAVIVDDGIATGATARAACQVARAHGARRVVLAVPVAPRGWEDQFGGDADELVAFATPDPFWAIGEFYADFSPTSDEEVVSCLEQALSRMTAESGEAGVIRPRNEDVEINAGGVLLAGRLSVPESAIAMVVFAHGSGSSRHSPRNRKVAAVLNDAGLGTLLFDLLTGEEEPDRDNVFDVELLAGRLGGATRWLRRQPSIGALPIGYFGASTGAAAALWAAALPELSIGAVVSRGGRPDLAGPRLAAVEAPTLLIVGEDDGSVLELNRRALAQMRCESSLVVIPHATHLFEEPGTLAEAARVAREWFVAHLSDQSRPGSVE